VASPLAIIVNIGKLPITRSCIIFKVFYYDFLKKFQ
jgi:hypothetical protein